MVVAENKLDAVFSMLANNPAIYQQLMDAVEVEVLNAQAELHTHAVQALYHSEAVPQACGRGGVYQTWSDILARLRRFQHK